MQMQKGFSYVELLMALAVLWIIMVPVFPAVAQARANSVYAEQRHQAQARASELATALRLASEKGDGPQAVLDIFAARDGNGSFIYRAGVYTVGASSADALYTAGEDVSLLPPPEPKSFQTDFNIVFAGARWMVTEVYDTNGNLAGQSVGMVN